MPKTDGAKYLGVKLESSLGWNGNTNYIPGKASSRLGYIRRTTQSSLQHQKSCTYKYLVRPVTEYSSTVWNGNLTVTQANSIEAIQRRMARLVFFIKRTDRTTSTTKLLEQLEWETLQSRREKRRFGIFCTYIYYN